MTLLRIVTVLVLPSTLAIPLELDMASQPNVSFPEGRYYIRNGVSGEFLAYRGFTAGMFFLPFLWPAVPYLTQRVKFQEQTANDWQLTHPEGFEAHEFSLEIAAEQKKDGQPIYTHQLGNHVPKLRLDRRHHTFSRKRTKFVAKRIPDTDNQFYLQIQHQHQTYWLYAEEDTLLLDKELKTPLIITMVKQGAALTGKWDRFKCKFQRGCQDPVSSSQ